MCTSLTCTERTYYSILHYYYSKNYSRIISSGLLQRHLRHEPWKQPMSDPNSDINPLLILNPAKGYR